MPTDFSMFKELPSWAVYIRHATDVKFTNITLNADKKDYRLPVVLDDVHKAQFSLVKVKQPGRKNIFYLYKSTEVVTDKTAKASNTR